MFQRLVQKNQSIREVNLIIKNWNKLNPMLKSAFPMDRFRKAYYIYAKYLGYYDQIFGEYHPEITLLLR